MRNSDWSSDVCSSDLRADVGAPGVRQAAAGGHRERVIAARHRCGAEPVEEVERVRQRQLRRRVARADPVELRDEPLLEAVADHRRVQRLAHPVGGPEEGAALRSEEHTSELQSLMRISYAVFCLKKKTI